MKEVRLFKSDITKRVKTHLSIIGKRLNLKPGDKNYSLVTLTDNEMPVIDDYFRGAYAYLAGQFPDILIVYDSTPADTVKQLEGGGTSTTINPSQAGFSGSERYDDAKDKALSDIFSSYILSYCIGSYLAMNYPDLAKKYQSEAASYLVAARNILYTKAEPSSNNKSNLNAPTIS